MLIQSQNRRWRRSATAREWRRLILDIDQHLSAAWPFHRAPPFFLCSRYIGQSELVMNQPLMRNCRCSRLPAVNWYKITFGRAPWWKNNTQKLQSHPRARFTNFLLAPAHREWFMISAIWRTCFANLMSVMIAYARSNETVGEVAFCPRCIMYLCQNQLIFCNSRKSLL